MHYVEKITELPCCICIYNISECKKYNYLEANGVVVGKNNVLRGSVWCYSNCYNYYMVYTYYILNVNNMGTSKYL